MPPQLQRAPTGVDEPAPVVGGDVEHVALLLPLSGPLRPAGVSVRDGFLAARLAELGKLPGSRSYTPAQVREIVEALGEP